MYKYAGNPTTLRSRAKAFPPWARPCVPPTPDQPEAESTLVRVYICVIRPSVRAAMSASCADACAGATAPSSAEGQWQPQPGPDPGRTVPL